MLMSVNWGSIHLTPMPTALTQVEASAVHAWMALMGQVVHAAALVVCLYITYELHSHQYMAVVVVRSQYVST